MVDKTIIVFVLLFLHLQQVSASYVHLRTIRLLPAKHHKSRRNIEVLETHVPMISSSTHVPSSSPEPNEKSYQQPSGLSNSGPTYPTKAPSHGSYLFSSSSEPSSERTNDLDHVKSKTPSLPYSKHPSSGKGIPMHSKSTIRPSSLQTSTPTIPSAERPAGFSNRPSISPSFIENQTLSPMVSAAPSSKKLTSTAPNDPNINPTSPSATPIAQDSSYPTLVPSSPITERKSQAPSIELSPSPSSIVTSSTTLRPSTSLSSTPSIAVSDIPSLIASESPSQDPSHSPTLKESLLPSSAPTIYPSDVINSPSISPSFIENQTLSPMVSAAPSSEKLTSTAPTDPNINPTSPSATPIAQDSSNPTLVPSSSITERKSQAPSIEMTPSPSSITTSSTTLRPSTSLSSTPSIAVSDIPSLTLVPSSSITERKSQAPSIELTPSPSSITTSSTTLRPSTSLSSTPSIAVSDIPSLIASESPSQDPSHSPTSKESLLPSLAPTSSDISILNVTLGYIERAVNDEEKMQLQDVIKEFLEEMDVHLTIYSVTIISHSLLSTDSRKLMSISSEDGKKLLNVLIRINGELQNSLNANFSDHIKSLLMDNLSILQARLAEVLPIFQMYTEKDDSRYGETEEPSSSRRLIVKIGAGVGAVGILALVAFLYRGRSIGGVTTTPPRQSTLHLVNDATPLRSTIERSICHETDIENQSIPKNSPSANPIEQDTLGYKDIISTLSYSETSSERLQPDHFTLTSSDTSEKLAFMGTISSDNQQEYKTESQFISHDPVSSHTETLQVQQLRRPVFDPPPKYKPEDRMEQESIDNSSNHGSVVQSEVSQPRHKGITKLLACFAANARANYANCSHPKYDNEREHSTRLSFRGRAKTGEPKVSRARNSSQQHMDYDEDEWIEQLEGDDGKKGSNKVSSDVSISSLSCFSSFSGNRSFGGDLYEVMISNEKNLGLVVKSDGSGPWVHHVKPASPLTALVKKGDYILSIDGTDTRRMTAQQLSRWLHEYSNKRGQKKEKTIVFKSPLEIDPSSRQMI